MKSNAFVFLGMLLIVCSVTSNSMAANVSFDRETYIGLPGEQIQVTVSYDAIDSPIFFGTVDILYDPAVIEFVSFELFTFPPFMGFPQEAASSPGSLVAPGEYSGLTFGTFEFFSGLNTAADFGVFTFVILGAGGDGGCGSTLCLIPSASVEFPFLAVDTGLPVTDQFFTNGITSANVSPVPVPAAIWCLLGGIGVLLNIKRAGCVNRIDT